MEYIIVGLGNPGIEYEQTRHNVGRAVVQKLQERWQTSDWRDDKKLRAKISQGLSPSGEKVKLVLPDNYMNRSGASVSPLIKNSKQAERLVVVHDDIDLGVGMLRIAFNRGAGGHRGVSSIERSLKTREYVRIRIGVVPITPTGKLRKPKGEEKVHEFILKKMAKREVEALEAVMNRAVGALECLLEEGRVSAMCRYNGSTQ